MTGRSFFTTWTCLLLERAKSLGDVWFNKENGEAFHSCWRSAGSRSTCWQSGQTTSQHQTNSTPNKACIKTAAWELCSLCYASQCLQEVTQQRGRVKSTAFVTSPPVRSGMHAILQHTPWPQLTLPMHGVRPYRQKHKATRLLAGLQLPLMTLS